MSGTPPYRRTGAGTHLQRRNPLAKILATAPMMLFLVFTRGPYIPGLVILVALVTLAVLGGLPARRLARTVAGLVGLVAAFLLVYPLAAAGDVTAGSPVLLRLWGLEITVAGVWFGLSTGSRIAALLSCALLFSVSTNGTDLIRALVQQWRVPYRLGYSTMAALRFVPRFNHELATIRAAHTVRGVSDRRGLRPYLRRARRYSIPLLASGVRHAERVALAMDARGFGAHRSRTYLRRMRLTAADLAFIAAAWAVSGGVVAAVHQLGLMSPLRLLG